MQRNEAKREQILRAVERLLDTQRPHEITTDQIAHAANVGKGTIYRHFQNKDDLFFQAALSGYDELCELLRTDVPVDAPFQEQLLLAAQKISGFFRSRRQVVRMMQSDDGRMPWTRENLRHHWASRRQQLIAAVTRIMQRGVSESRLRHDIPTDVLAHVFLGMLRTWARDLSDQDQAVRKHETLVELFCYGAAASHDPSGQVNGKSAAKDSSPRRADAREVVDAR